MILIATQLDICKPLDKDLKSGAKQAICKALNENNAFKARQLIEANLTPTSHKWCIVALKTAITLVCNNCSPSVIREATFNLLAC